MHRRLLILVAFAAVAVPANASVFPLQVARLDYSPCAVIPPPSWKPYRGVLLQTRLEKNQAIFLETISETFQAMTVMQMEVKQTQQQTFYLQITPLHQDPKGNWIVEQRILGIKMEIDIGGNKISYCSYDPAPPVSPMSDFFKALIGAEFRLHLGPDLTVRKVVGADRLRNKLAAINPQMEALLKTVLGDDAVKQMGDPFFGQLPNRTVSKGESWTKISELDMGPIGRYKTTNRYTYEGPEKTLERIGVVTTMEFLPPQNMGAGLPFVIRQGNLKSLPSKGTLWFDCRLGRMVRSETSLELAGSLTIDIGGMETVVTLKQTQRTIFKTYDRNPLAK